MSYSQICGTVQVHPAGTPDGFRSFFKYRPTITEICVDGLSITYGDTPKRNHIWTYAPTTLLSFVDRNRCYIFDYGKEPMLDFIMLV